MGTASRIMRGIRNLGSLIQERCIRYTIGLNSLANAFSSLYKLIFGKRTPADDLELIYTAHFPKANPVVWSSDEEIYMVCEVLIEKGISAIHNRYDRHGHLVVRWNDIAYVLNYVYRMVYGEGMIDIFTRENCKEKYEELEKRIPESLMKGLLERRPEWAGELYQNHLLAYYLAGKEGASKIDVDNIEIFYGHLSNL